MSEAARMYERVKRHPKEGTAAEAIKCHAQACGYVAHALDLHPDQVAREVAVATGPQAERSEAIDDYELARLRGFEEAVKKAVLKRVRPRDFERVYPEEKA